LPGRVVCSPCIAARAGPVGCHRQRHRQICQNSVATPGSCSARGLRTDRQPPDSATFAVELRSRLLRSLIWCRIARVSRFWLELGWSCGFAIGEFVGLRYVWTAILCCALRSSFLVLFWCPRLHWIESMEFIEFISWSSF
jgi:hypothetical protein